MFPHGGLHAGGGVRSAHGDVVLEIPWARGTGGLCTMCVVHPGLPGSWWSLWRHPLWLWALAPLSVDAPTGCLFLTWILGALPCLYTAIKSILCVYVCMSMCVCVCMYVCVYVRVCMCLHVGRGEVGSGFVHSIVCFVFSFYCLFLSCTALWVAFLMYEKRFINKI